MGCQLCNGEDQNQLEMDVKGEAQKAKSGGGRLRGGNPGKHGQQQTPNKNIFSIQAGATIDSICQISAEQFAVGLSNGTIAVYAMGSPSPTQQYTLTGHSGTIKSLIHLRDGRLASAGGDATIKIWRLYERRLDVDMTSHTNWVNALLQPKGSDLLISGSSDNTIKITNLLNMNKVEHTINVEKSVNCLCDLFDGKFASNSGDQVVVWDLNTKTELFEFDGAFSTVVSLVYLQDGKLISGAINGVVKIYDINTKQKVMNLKDSGNLNMLQMIDKNVLAVAIGNGIKLWNINTKEEIRTLTGHSEEVRVITPFEGNLLISGGVDKLIKVWE